MPQTASAPKPLHIFKPGRWTTMAGEVIAFSQADIEATARAYNPAVGKAPIVIGHPATDDPAQGWAGGLVANERGLFAEPTKVDPAFAESVRSGRYGTISAKFFRPQDPSNPVPGVWYLRHIGFLGAVTPAVKGLDDPAFTNVDDGCVCFQEGVAFGEWDGMTNATLWRGLREWFIGKFGTDEADKVLPGYDVRALEIGASEELNLARVADGRPLAFADPAAAAPAAAPVSQPPQESAVTEQEAAQLREQAEASARRVAELEGQQRATAAAADLAANTAFADQMAAEARILPVHVAQVVAIGTQLQTTPDVQFGDGDAKKPLVDVFKDFVRSLPVQVKTGEQATRDRAAADAQGDADVSFADGADPERLKQHKAALAYAKEHKTTYAAAARAVIK